MAVALASPFSDDFLRTGWGYTRHGKMFTKFGYNVILQQLAQFNENRVDIRFHVTIPYDQVWYTWPIDTSTINEGDVIPTYDDRPIGFEPTSGDVLKEIISIPTKQFILMTQPEIGQVLMAEFEKMGCILARRILHRRAMPECFSCNSKDIFDAYEDDNPIPAAVGCNGCGGMFDKDDILTISLQDISVPLNNLKKLYGNLRAMAENYDTPRYLMMHPETHCDLMSSYENEYKNGYLFGVKVKETTVIKEGLIVPASSKTWHYQLPELLAPA